MKPFLSKWPTHLGVGLFAGAAIVYVDNWSLEGEVSPIIIVALLLAATVMAGAMWMRSLAISDRHVGMRTIGSRCQARPGLARHAAPEHLYFDPVSRGVHSGGRDGRHWLRNVDPQACDRPGDARRDTCLTTRLQPTVIRAIEEPDLSAMQFGRMDGLNPLSLPC